MCVMAFCTAAKNLTPEARASAAHLHQPHLQRCSCLSSRILLPLPLLFLTLHALSHAVKVPQIAKIVRANSAKGVSLFSHLLELYSYTFTLSYPVSQGNPFRCVRP